MIYNTLKKIKKITDRQKENMPITKERPVVDLPYLQSKLAVELSVLAIIIAIISPLLFGIYDKWVEFRRNKNAYLIANCINLTRANFFLAPNPSSVPFIFDNSFQTEFYTENLGNILPVLDKKEERAQLISLINLMQATNNILDKTGSQPTEALKEKAGEVKNSLVELGYTNEVCFEIHPHYVNQPNDTEK